MLHSLTMIRNTDGNTPLDLAESVGDTRVAAAIRSAMAASKSTSRSSTQSSSSVKYLLQKSHIPLVISALRSKVSTE